MKQRYVRRTYKPDSQRPQKWISTGRFTCTDNKTKEILQGIIFQDHSVIIGFDCWRLLNKIDTCDYPFQRYESLQKAKENVTIIQTRKAYYLPYTE